MLFFWAAQEVPFGGTGELGILGTGELGSWALLCARILAAASPVLGFRGARACMEAQGYLAQHSSRAIEVNNE